mmetsp:Transcript_2685/g.6463  ORF Transcript_2685/g.6463 Transcript_2685/m.6463 type:complete len:213 (+) Transcript_2685:118-756(+)
MAAIGISDAPAYVSMAMAPPFGFMPDSYNFDPKLGVEYFDKPLPQKRAAYIDMGNMGVPSMSLTFEDAPDEATRNAPKEMLKRQLKKTQLCMFWKRNCCAKGSSCTFAHSVEELKALPDLRRTSLCKQWLKGHCPQSADSCRYAHGEAYLRRTFEDASRKRGRAARKDRQLQERNLQGGLVPLPPGIDLDAPEDGGDILEFAAAHVQQAFRI